MREKNKKEKISLDPLHRFIVAQNLGKTSRKIVRYLFRLCFKAEDMNLSIISSRDVGCVNGI